MRKLVNETQTAGTHEVVWNGLDDDGNDVASGIYFYQLKAKGLTKSRKMILLR